MALHAQQQIFNALQSLLAAGGTVAGVRVFLDRVDPLQADELPAIIIEEANGESAEIKQLDGTQRRESIVNIYCCLVASTAAATDCRAFGLEVEKLVAASAALRTLCQYGLSITESRTITNGEGDRLLATRLQTWQLAYRVHPTNPDIINP